jgi:hypothetical protein
MRKRLSVTIEIKLNFSMCLLAIAAIIKAVSYL